MDPDPNQDKVEPKEEIPKEPEAQPKEEPKAEELPPKTIPVTNPETGETFDLNPREIVSLAEFGLMEHTNKQKPKEEPQEEETLEDRFKKLEGQIHGMQTKSKNEKQGQVILQSINQAAEKFDLTKEGGPLTEKIKLMTLVRLNQNPKLSPATVFAEETKSYMEILEKMNEKSIANDKIKGALDGTLRGGSMPTVDKSKEYTAEDLRTTGSREAMRLFLESQS